MDTEIQNEVWNSRLPIEFTLHPSDVGTYEKPQPQYLLISRITFFPICIESVQKYFEEYLETNLDEGEDATSRGKSEMWLEYNGIPLKWHLPVGVLYDLLKPVDDTFPWKINVRFKNFPEEDLIKLNVDGKGSLAAVESHLLQSIKEADQLKHKGKIIKDMQKHEHKQLWSAVCSDRFDIYWAIASRLMENSTEKPVLNLPIRIFTPVHSHFIQRRIRPYDDVTNERRTIGDVCATVLLEAGIELDLDNYDMIVLGVRCDYNTPALWLTIQMCCVDSWLYVILRKKIT